ncbi:MAG: hypothetical protein ACM3JI_05865 [Anaerolineae bacterium]
MRKVAIFAAAGFVILAGAFFIAPGTMLALTLIGSAIALIGCFRHCNKEQWEDAQSNFGGRTVTNHFNGFFPQTFGFGSNNNDNRANARVQKGQGDSHARSSNPPPSTLNTGGPRNVGGDDQRVKKGSG